MKTEQEIKNKILGGNNMEKWNLVKKNKLQAGAHHCHIKTFYVKGDGAGVAYAINYYINKNKIFSKLYFTSSADVINSTKYPDTREGIVVEFRKYCCSKMLFDEFYNFFFESEIEKITKICNRVLLEYEKIPWYFTEKLQWNEQASMSLFHDIFNPFSSAYDYLSDKDRFEILKRFSEEVVAFYESNEQLVDWEKIFYDGEQRLKKYLFILKEKGVIRITRNEFISNLETETETEEAVTKEMKKFNFDSYIHYTGDFWIDDHIKDDNKKIFKTEIREK